MSGSSSSILRLYKTLLRESQKFVDYNYRSYAVRRVQDAFKENKNITKQSEIEQQIKFAHENLNMIKRQATIGHLFNPNTTLSFDAK